MSETYSWLRDDRVRRRKALKKTLRKIRLARRKERIKNFFRPIVGALLLLAVIASVIGSISVLYTRIVEASTVTYTFEVAEPEVIEVEEVVEDTNKVVLATVTAYTSSVDETDDTPFITASGASTGHGVIACPSKYEFGTQVEIEGRQYTCEDRMNKRYRDQERFDIWVETKSDAFQWGVRKLEVIIAMK